MKKNKVIYSLALIAASVSLVSAMETVNNTAMVNGDTMMKGNRVNISFMSSLMMGSRGSDVVSLQTFLEEKGFLEIPSNYGKGYFGGLTKKALIEYQASVGLPATGYFGAMTRAKLNSSMMVTGDTMMKSDSAMKNDTMMNGGSAMHSNSMMIKDNGVMVGGALMITTRDIVDNAVLASNVTTVVAAVKAAGLVDTLKSAGPFTVFAPNNAAFAALPAGTVASLLLPENKSKLVDILTYHVVAGKYKLVDFYDGQTLTTVEGKKLTFTKVNGQIMINGAAMIETPNVISSNGVTHVITSVLLPQ